MRNKRKIGFLLAIALLVTYIPATTYAADNEEYQIQKIEAEQTKIDELLDRRAELVSLEKFDEVENVEQELASLGVEKLTPEEVQTQFGNTNTPNTRINVPVSNNVTWLSQRVDYPHYGTTYEVQTLIAQANEKNSDLKKSGSLAVSSSYSWEVGFMNLITALATSAAGQLSSGASLAVTVYDSVSGLVSGISKTTKISSASVVYTYSHVTTATFKYVKEKGHPDMLQELTFASTKGLTTIGYQYPAFNYSGGSVTPNVIQGQRTLVSTPKNYNSTLAAVEQYNYEMGATKGSFVNSVSIKGIENKTVGTIYPICPFFPPQL